MGAFHTKLATQLAVLAILSAGMSTPAKSASMSPPPSPPKSSPPPSPPSSPTQSPQPAPQPNAPTGHSPPLGGTDPGLTAQPQLPDPSSYADVGDAIKAISLATEDIIYRCDRHIPNTQRCIADALDSYAAALAQLTPQLPVELRNLPNIVATAARRVRAAHTSRQAIHALSIAISAVHKTIALLRAVDPVTLEAETREGTFVAETLQVASIKLEKASGL